VNHQEIKALFLKSRAFNEMTEFKSAIAVLEDLLLFEPGHEAGTALLKTSKNA